MNLREHVWSPEPYNTWIHPEALKPYGILIRPINFAASDLKASSGLFKPYKPQNSKPSPKP